MNYKINKLPFLDKFLLNKKKINQNNELLSYKCSKNVFKQSDLILSLKNSNNLFDLKNKIKNEKKEIKLIIEKKNNFLNENCNKKKLFINDQTYWTNSKEGSIENNIFSNTNLSIDIINKKLQSDDWKINNIGVKEMIYFWKSKKTINLKNLNFKKITELGYSLRSLLCKNTIQMIKIGLKIHYIAFEKGIDLLLPIILKRTYDLNTFINKEAFKCIKYFSINCSISKFKLLLDNYSSKIENVRYSVAYGIKNIINNRKTDYNKLDINIKEVIDIWISDPSHKVRSLSKILKFNISRVKINSTIVKKRKIKNINLSNNSTSVIGNIFNNDLTSLQKLHLPKNKNYLSLKLEKKSILNYQNFPDSEILNEYIKNFNKYDWKDKLINFKKIIEIFNRNKLKIQNSSIFSKFLNFILELINDNNIKIQLESLEFFLKNFLPCIVNIKDNIINLIVRNIFKVYINKNINVKNLAFEIIKLLLNMKYDLFIFKSIFSNLKIFSIKSKPLIFKVINYSLNSDININIKYLSLIIDYELKNSKNKIAPVLMDLIKIMKEKYDKIFLSLWSKESYNKLNIY